MDPRDRMYEIMEGVQEQLEEIIDEYDSDEIAEMKLAKLEEMAMEFIYDYKNAVETLDLMEIGV